MITVNVTYDNTDEILCQAFSLLEKYSRGIIVSDSAEKGDICVKLLTDKTLPPEAYSIKKTSENSYKITGADRLGICYGVGRFLHRGYKNLSDETCVPEKKIRAIYFATHFNNYYQVAPTDEISDYVEEQLLWGCNCISMWFDMHHFASAEDNEAKALRERMHKIYKKAKSLGMKTSLSVLGNEYYRGAPKELLAENSVDATGYFRKMTGFYNTEICPSKPEGERMILSSRRSLFEYFSDINLDYIILWPYDQGGCTCPDCRPWGINGFISISIKIAKEIKAVFPHSQCILSAWRFDSFTNGEWSGLIEKLPVLSRHFDYLMADFASKKTPVNIVEYSRKSNMKLLGFPDISMLATPWGGFGAAPAPTHLEKVFCERESVADGGFCYSEGVFEDMNKILMLGLYFGNSTVREIAEDYFRYYFSEDAAAFANELSDCLEKSLRRTRIDADGKENLYPTREVTGELPAFPIENLQTVQRAYELALLLEHTARENAKKDMRFQMVFQRAVIDRELMRNNGKMTAETEKAARILEEIYYAQKADYVVSPITEEAVRQNRGHI